MGTMLPMPPRPMLPPPVCAAARGAAATRAAARTRRRILASFVGMFGQNAQARRRLACSRKSEPPRATPDRRIGKVGQVCQHFVELYEPRLIGYVTSAACDLLASRGP